MSDKLHGKMSGRSAKAFLLISCMLVCAMSPVITTWDDDNSSVVASSDDKFKYVSLGDSMVNGYGMIDYYDVIGSEKKNWYGFELWAADTYPAQIRDELNTIFGVDNVSAHQLAISGLRSADLRAILDAGFIGDAYTQSNCDGQISGAINKTGDDIFSMRYCSQSSRCAELTN